MIQIYAPTNTRFEMNGDEILFPEICEARTNLNGAWELDLSHPIDDEERWKNIVEEAVIAVPTFVNEKQLFRIKNVQKTDTSVMTKAYPIFFDAADDLYLEAIHPTNVNGQQALDTMLSGSKYLGESDIPTKTTAYFEDRNMMDCLNGENDPTFIKRWGGEIIYDNFKVIVNEKIGQENGAEVRYGKNMEHINYQVDMSDICTRIIPVAYNGRKHSNIYVDSPNINKYVKIYHRKIVFEEIRHIDDMGENDNTAEYTICATQEELDAALQEKCREQFEYGLDLPKVTIAVDMIMLSQTEEYKDFAEIEKIGLGDTVYCYNRDLDIKTKARVIELIWDCIENCAKSVLLGNYEYNYFSHINSTINRIEGAIRPNGTVVAERIKGTMDAMETSLRLQSSAAKKVDGRAFLIEDLDPDSPLYGAMEAGTQGLRIADEKDNLGNWVWKTAITAAGIVADTIVAGILSDKAGMNYWNLGTGEFKLSAETRIGGQTVQEAVTSSASAKIKEFINSIYTPQIENLQAQIDGQIETYYYNYKPTLQNEPASLWETDEKKQKHEGDLFFDKTTGYAYRFHNDNGYKWVLVQDTDITKALADASAAKDTADNKRRVFISEPVPPYDAGDLWVTSQNTGEGAIKICITARSSGRFDDADWIDPKYIDSTDVDNAIEIYDTKLDQTSIFNKLTNNGTLQGIYLQDGQLYINATYLATGILTDKTGKNFWDLVQGVLVANNLSVEESVSTEVLHCEEIGNAAYPKTLISSPTIYVNADSGNDDQKCENGAVFQTLQGAINSIPKFINAKYVYIEMQTDSKEDIDIRGFTGGFIWIYLAGHTLYGRVNGYTAKHIRLYGGTIAGGGSDLVGIVHPPYSENNGSTVFNGCFNVYLSNLKIYGADKLASGLNETNKVAIVAQGATYIYADEIEIVNAVRGVSSISAHIHMNKSYGIASETGFYCTTGGLITLATNNQMGGSTRNTYTSNGGEIRYTGVTFETGNASSSTTTAPTIKVAKNVTYTSTKGNAIQYYGTSSAKWRSDNTPKVGNWDYGNHVAFWFFGDNFENIAKKDVTKIEITFTRNSGGNHSAVTHNFYVHNYETQPSTVKPSYDSVKIGSASVATGNSATITITDSALIAKIIKSKGICSVPPAQSKAYYSVMSGTMKVKFYYQE